MAKILVVEDEFTVRELVRMHLETVGHSVLTAPDCAAGLVAAQNNADLDLIIAGADGLAVLPALRRAGRRTLPVIFLSAMEDRQSVHRVMNPGADELISKPVARRELLQAVKASLARCAAVDTTDNRTPAVRGESADATTIPVLVAADSHGRGGRARESAPARGLHDDLSADSAPPGYAGSSPYAATSGRGARESIEGYRLIHKLGEGGMSKVFLAEHLATRERRVLKMIPIDGDEDMLQRFLQEYALVAQVRHPNVARIYEQGFSERSAYISMEYLSAGDLRERLGTGLAVPEALRYLGQVALGLTAIHDRGIIHRDLKPENLMFRADGMLVLADFGIAKQLSTELMRTQHGEVYGTPYYMSPEHSRGFTLDGRSDLYSLGVILYEMLTGVKPYTATRAEAIVYQHIHAPIPRLPAQSASLQGVLDRLMAKAPQDRYASALDLVRVLRTRQDPRSGSGEPAGTTEGPVQQSVRSD